MSTKLAENATRRFAAHETFAPRFGWLRKAFQQVSTDYDAVEKANAQAAETEGPDAAPRTTGSDIFLRKTAPVELGVGKNMVNAMRYWSQAFGVTREQPAMKSSRAMHAHPTDEGQWLLGDDGADPWLEDPASLWLLHWWLLRRSTMAPTWWVAFNLLPSQRFTEAELVNLVEQQVALAAWDPVNRSSIDKDVDCLTKMYAARRTAANSPGSVEDLLDCPFRELGLLEAVTGQPRRWRFVDVPRLAVPPAIAAYAALDFMATNELTGQVTLPILAHEPGSVGRILRLTEPALAAALEQVAAGQPELRVTDALGQRSLVVEGDPGALAEQVLAAYYGREVAATTPADGAVPPAAAAAAVDSSVGSSPGSSTDTVKPATRRQRGTEQRFPAEPKKSPARPRTSATGKRATSKAAS